MACTVDRHPEFARWLSQLEIKQRLRVMGRIQMLEEQGKQLQYPFARKLHCSERVRELRMEVSSRSLRLLYAITGPHSAVLLLGGDKTGDYENWYVDSVPIVEKYLKEFEAGDAAKAAASTERHKRSAKQKPTNKKGSRRR